MPPHLRLVPRYDSAEAPPPTSVPAMPQPWEPRRRRRWWVTCLLVLAALSVGIKLALLAYYFTRGFHAHHLQGKDVPLSDLPMRRP